MNNAVVNIRVQIFFFRLRSFIYLFGRTERHVGSQFPDPCPVHWKRGVLTTGLPGNAPRVQSFVWTYVSIFLGHIPRSGISAS